MVANDSSKPRFEIQTFASATELAMAAATTLMTRLSARTDTTTPFCLALSGGRISADFCKAVAALGKTQPDAFAGVHFFWADERCVPPDHPDSNFALADAAMLKPLRIPENHVHRIRGEVNPDSAALEAVSELRGTCRNSAAGIPVLELVLLGMGEDGHIASLFPPAPAKIDNGDMIFFPVTASKPPPRRITMSYQLLRNASEAWVLVSGAGKEAAFANSIKQGGQTPLARLLAERRSTLILKNITL